MDLLVRAADFVEQVFLYVRALLFMEFVSQCELEALLHESLHRRLVHFSKTLLALSESQFEFLADVAEHMNQELVGRVHVLGHQRAPRSFAVAMSTASERASDSRVADLIQTIMRYFAHLFARELGEPLTDVLNNKFP